MVDMGRRLACVIVLGSCLLAAGCAAPVPDDGAYRHAALQTAMAMVSDLAGAQLAARDCPECTMSIPVATRLVRKI